jgi:hypothetical protein
VIAMKRSTVATPIRGVAVSQLSATASSAPTAKTVRTGV